MKTVIIFFSMLLFVGCGCKEEIIRYPLNTYEKNIIPYTETQVLEYKNENVEIIKATVSGKEVSEKDLNISDDEGCISNLMESHQCKIIFNNTKRNLFINVEKSYQNTLFYIYEIDNNQQSMVNFDIKNYNNQNIEEALTNISIEGFQYNDVFVFEVNPNNIESDFETIVYSPQKGIVFLKKRTGGYLKLEE